MKGSAEKWGTMKGGAMKESPTQLVNKAVRILLEGILVYLCFLIACNDHKTCGTIRLMYSFGRSVVTLPIKLSDVI